MLAWKHITKFKLHCTPACVFVVNKVYDYILLNSTTVNETLHFYFVNKMKIE